MCMCAGAEVLPIISHVDNITPSSAGKLHEGPNRDKLKRLLPTARQTPKQKLQHVALFGSRPCDAEPNVFQHLAFIAPEFGLLRDACYGAFESPPPAHHAQVGGCVFKHLACACSTYSCNQQSSLQQLCCCVGVASTCCCSHAAVRMLSLLTCCCCCFALCRRGWLWRSWGRAYMGMKELARAQC